MKKYLICFIIVFIFCEVSFAEEILFTYKPKGGMNYEEIIQTVHTRRIESLGEIIDISTTRNDVQILETEGGGYKLTSKALLLERRRDEQLQPNPIADALLNLEIVYTINQEGFLKKIDGYDELEKKIQSDLNPDLIKQYGDLINSEIWIQNDIKEYKKNIEIFLGRTVQLGDVWTAVESVNLGNDITLEYNMETLFKSILPCGDGNKECVEITFAYNSEPMGKNILSDDFKINNIENSGFNDLVITGEGMCLIDPKTMIIYKQEYNRTMSVFVKGFDGTNLKTTVIDKSEYSINMK